MAYPGRQGRRREDPRRRPQTRRPSAEQGKRRGQVGPPERTCVRIYGLDFTSAPGRRKPLIVLGCTLEGDSLRVEDSETLTDFGGFEDFLQRRGPWVCGIDRKSTRLNSSHLVISYAVFCL